MAVIFILFFCKICFSIKNPFLLCVGQGHCYVKNNVIFRQISVDFFHVKFPADGELKNRFIKAVIVEVCQKGVQVVVYDAVVAHYVVIQFFPLFRRGVKSNFKVVA